MLDDARSIPTYCGFSRPLGYLPAHIQSKIMKKAVVTKAKRCQIYINVVCTAGMFRDTSTNQLSTM